jgi:hypothetical protein
VAEKMVSVDWSIGRKRPSNVNLVIKPYLFVEARRMFTENRPVYVLQSDEKFIVPATDFASLNRRAVKHLALSLGDANFDSFSQFDKFRFQVNIF